MYIRKQNITSLIILSNNSQKRLFISFCKSNFSWEEHNTVTFQRFVLLGVRLVKQKSDINVGLGRIADTAVNKAIWVFFFTDQEPPPTDV